ncbi:MAG: single-stranded DNA-binding protein [Phycisphaerae bacterium]|jgi:single-strand DNA-binding protein|nr:single-stranded DNA-binding protein [Phycisphaerae bacterium]
MANYNKVILAGNLTRDPQLSYTPAQTPVVDFGMAINRTWRGQDGEKREETCFVDCRAFGRTAETINQYLSKGRPVLVEGRLRFSSWEKDGRKHSKLSVTVENFQFLGSAQGGGQGSYAPQQQAPAPQQAPPPQQQAPAPQPTPPPQAPQPDFGDEPAPPPDFGGGEDIPF